MRAIRSIGRRVKVTFARLRNRAGKFAFMGGKKRRQGIRKAKKTDKTMVVASSSSRDSFRDSKNLKARRKQAMGYAMRKPGAVVGFAMKKLFAPGGKGYGARMGSRNAFSTVKANIPQGFKDTTRAFAAKHNLGGKARSTWQVAQILGKDPVFVVGAVTSAILTYQAIREVSSIEKTRQARAKPFF